MIEVFTMFETEFMRKLGFLVFLLCILVSFNNQNAETKKGSSSPVSLSSEDSDSILTDPFLSHPIAVSAKTERIKNDDPTSLEYDFYRKSCPQAEQIVRSKVQQLYKVRPDVAPALLRLVFHDCFIEGCDASVLLDDADRINSEKDSPPNQSLMGFDLIDLIKADMEEACPGIVSCADIIVLAAREGVVLAGGPFYPLYTGRRDSNLSFAEVATYELPSPRDDLSQTLASFTSRGFDERETVSLLGAHSIGTIHCKFFHNRLYNFDGTEKPDPSLDTDFLNFMREKCDNSYVRSSPASSPSALSPSFENSPSSSTDDPGMEMDYNGPGSGFGTLYYRSLLQGRGILYADQQLMAGESTGSWVRAYASDASLFRQDFAQAMIKLSNLRVLTAPLGQVRVNCSKVA
ncbi:putative Peroxidase 48 [Malania oleifera]|uniref:putative Peroxidase 48 n=1 Tax=Malania oleifera TaxID=397392 RepID=UPI0025ADDE20|nr:putative Peroxidase 48 [Malania oleifera]